ncbi:MAG: HD domain-containing protein, partial [Clostridia bacterium]|nr:HD domain-containing protein [Clostridia bacterium]
MTDAKTLARARHLVEDSLSEKRCSHVFAVTEEMRLLARVFELSEEENDLLLAALLHDITKEKTLEAQLQLCAEYGIILSAEDRAVPKGLHAITGAAFAAREFSLSAPFADALRWHTTGRAEMTLYDKLLFLADYIEK